MRSDWVALVVVVRVAEVAAEEEAAAGEVVMEVQVFRCGGHRAVEVSSLGRYGTARCLGDFYILPCR